MPKYTNNLSVYDFKDTCRTCLGGGTMYPLNEKCFGTCLIEMLLSVTFVQFSDEDNLPLQICSKCKNSVTRAYNFAQQCLLADSKLQECLKNFQSSKCRNYTNPSETESKLEQTPEIVEDCSENNLLELHTEIKIEENSDEEINFKNVVVKCENMSENEGSSNKETCEMETESVAPNDEKLVSDTNMEDSDSEPDSLLKVDEKKSYRLREWQEATHSENVNPKTKCKICSKLVALHKIDTHICHSKVEFRCEFCGKLFNVKGTLLRHIQTHTGDRLYNCLKSPLIRTRRPESRPQLPPATQLHRRTSLTPTLKPEASPTQSPPALLVSRAPSRQSTAERSAKQNLAETAELQEAILQRYGADPPEASPSERLVTPRTPKWARQDLLDTLFGPSPVAAGGSPSPVPKASQAVRVQPPTPFLAPGRRALRTKTTPPRRAEGVPARGAPEPATTDETFGIVPLPTSPSAGAPPTLRDRWVRVLGDRPGGGVMWKWKLQQNAPRRRRQHRRRRHKGIQPAAP